MIARPRVEIAAAFSAVRQEIGYIAPSRVVAELGFHQDHPLRLPIRRHMYEHPTERFLFWGVARTVRKILQKGDPVAIWTDEYVERIRTSGLENLREHGDLSFILGEQKQTLIPALFEHAKERGVAEIVVVDDQLGNLQRVHAFAQDQDIPVRLVLVGGKQHGGDSLQEVRFSSINHVRQIERTVRRRSPMPEGKRLWVFDFNRTLLNTEAFERSMERGVRTIIKQGRRGRDLPQGH